MGKQKPNLQTRLIHAMRALPSDTKLQETIKALENHIIPEKDHVHVIEFILVLLRDRPELQSTHPQAQLLLNLHKECIEQVKAHEDNAMKSRGTHR